MLDSEIFDVPCTKPVYGLMGTGGTGKTYLATAFVERNPGWRYVGSTVRATYARLGYAGERVSVDLSPAERLHLQLEIFKDHAYNFARVIGEAEDDPQCRGVVMDRTLADHFGYCVFYCAEAITREVFDTLEALVEAQLRRFTRLFHLPYPPPFKTGDDGFRLALPAKDYAVDCVIFRHAVRFGATFVTEAALDARLHILSGH